MFSYANPVLSVLFTELAGFREGSGMLDGSFFLKMGEAFQKTFYLNGIVFLIQFLVVAVFFNFLISSK